MYHIFVSIRRLRVCHHLNQFMSCHGELYTCHHEGPGSCSFTPALHASIFLMESHASSFLCSDHPLCALHCFQGEMGEGTWCFHLPSQGCCHPPHLHHLFVSGTGIWEARCSHFVHFHCWCLCFLHPLYNEIYHLHYNRHEKSKAVSTFPSQAILGKL